MLIISILKLLLSNAVTLRRDKSILYSRVSIIILIYSSWLFFTSLYFTSLDRGIGLYGGLFHATSITHSFHIFIFLISALILQLTAFYSGRVWNISYSSLNKMLFYNLLRYLTITISALTLIILFFIFLISALILQLTAFYSGRVWNMSYSSLNKMLFYNLLRYLTITISALTLIILLFIFIPHEWLSLANILALILFNQ